MGRQEGPESNTKPRSGRWVKNPTAETGSSEGKRGVNRVCYVRRGLQGGRKRKKAKIDGQTSFMSPLGPGSHKLGTFRIISLTGCRPGNLKANHLSQKQDIKKKGVEGTFNVNVAKGKRRRENIIQGLPEKQKRRRIKEKGNWGSALAGTTTIRRIETVVKKRSASSASKGGHHVLEPT